MNGHHFPVFESLPHGWSMKVGEGNGQVQVVQEDHRRVLRLEIERRCMSWSRSLTANSPANPFLSWEWSVLTLPTAEAIRQSSQGDHCTAFYLRFSSREAPSRQTILEYIWDNARPVGAILVRPKEPSVHDVVVRSESSRLRR